MEGEQFRLIDTAIGLALIYLTLSIVVTGVVQLIASFLRLRSINLVQGMAMLLNEKNQAAGTWTFGQLLNALTTCLLNPRTGLATLVMGRCLQGRATLPVVGKEGEAVSGTLAGEVLSHPVINQLAIGDKVATHIDPKLFTAALVSVLSGKAGQTVDQGFADVAKLIDNIQCPQIKESLSAVIAYAQSRVDSAEDKAKAAAEAVADWYEQSMQQVSEWYKTRIQVITLVFAAVLTVGCNIDSFRLADALWNDNSLRNGLVEQALKTTGGQQSLAALCQGMEATEAIQCQLKTIHQATASINSAPVGWGEQQKVKQPHWYYHIPGWLLTILALSMGAPFWFDMLAKVVKMRGGDKSADSKQGGAA